MPSPGPDGATAQGSATLADLLHRGPCDERTARAVGAVVAEALARLHEDGITHGDVRAANVVFSPDGDLRLVGSDADAGVGERDDVLAVAALVVACVTTATVDPRADWSATALGALGCPPELAADLAVAFTRPTPATRLAAVLHRRGIRLPEAPDARPPDGDATDTVDIASVALPGLTPRGGPADAPMPR